MFAPAESEYVLQNSDNVPSHQLYKKYFPLQPQISTASPIAGTGEPGLSEIYRSDASPTTVKTYILPGLETLYGIIEDTIAQSWDNPVFKYRPYNYETNKSEPYYEAITYGELKAMKDNLGAGILYHLQNSPFKQAHKYECHRKIDNHIRDYQTYDIHNHSFVVTFYSGNRYEWLVSDLACTSYSLTSSALYDTLGDDTSEYILQLTQSPIVIASKAHVLSLINLKKQNPEQLGHVISIVCMDPLSGSDPLRKEATSVSIQLLDFKQILGIGKLFPFPNLPPKPSSLFTINFTSGTSGSKPKGVSLTQKNVAAGCTFLITHLEHVQTCFAFLPLAHIFERETSISMFIEGGCIFFPQMNYSPATLIEDLRLSKPERVSLVPRIFNKFEATIKAMTVNNPAFSNFKRGIFEKAFTKKMEAQSVADGSTGKLFLYDNLILKAIKKSFGFDNLKYAVTGSAPINPDTIRFLKASLDIGLVAAYGLTETFAGLFASRTYEANPSYCGSQSITCEIRVKEQPSMNYLLTDKNGPRGELLIRGTPVFGEYYKDPEETAKALDKAGWFHTGDVAEISRDTGRLRIVDRVKNFFKLAQGEYISPEHIENTYLTNNPILAQVYVHGDSLQPFLVGIIGIQKPFLVDFLTNHCNLNANILVSESDDRILEYINDINNKRILLQTLNKSVSSLKGFQKLHNVFIEFEPLTADRNVVTPTMKLKRPVAKDFFRDHFIRLYTEGSLVLKEKL